MSKKCLLFFSFDEFQKEITDLGLEAYRAKQILEWIHQKLVFDFHSMTNIPLSAREKLSEHFTQIVPKEIARLTDEDGTMKISIETENGANVEAVAIPDDEALTYCLSSQAGCPVGCKFCRTGTGKYRGDLKASEIIAQLFTLIQAKKTKPTNIVFMGMGEPFLNSHEVFSAIDVLTDKKGFNFATRRITISTVGVPKGIRELAERPGEVNLAVSLHSADNDTRSRLVPLNKTHPLEKLRSAIVNYIEKTGRRVSFEVVLLKKINDQDYDAMNLVNFCQGLLCHINLVRFNPFPSCHFLPSEKSAENEFKKIIKKAGIPVTVRRSRGNSILAACGQLSGDQFSGDQ